MINIAEVAFEKQSRFGFDPRGVYNSADLILRKDFAESQKLADDEFIDGETGLVTCKYCKTPRQHFIDRYFGWKYLDCKCLELMHETEWKANKAKALAEAIRKEAFADYPIGVKYTFFDDDKTSALASKYSRDYVADFENKRSNGRGILFWGGVGTGKTFIATAVMNELINKGNMVRFVRVSEMVRAMNNFVTSPTALDRYKSCAAIVLDDLGAEDGKQQNLDAITRFLDFTEAFNIPIIVTTNLSATDLTSGSELGFKRVADRLVARCDLIQLRGTSRRQQQSYERQKTIGGSYERKQNRS